jgi:hypothetical protein
VTGAGERHSIDVRQRSHARKPETVFPFGQLSRPAAAILMPKITEMLEGSIEKSKIEGHEVEGHALRKPRRPWATIREARPFCYLAERLGWKTLRVLSATSPFFYRKRSFVSDAEWTLISLKAVASLSDLQEVGTSWVRRLTRQDASDPSLRC